MLHELKTDSAVYRRVYVGLKTYELRKNDRDFKVGDQLLLRETLHTGAEMQSGAPLRYTGSQIIVDVVHVLYGPIYGLLEGWCIMSIFLTPQ